MKIRKDMIVAQLDPEDEITPKCFWFALGRAYYFDEKEWGKKLSDIPTTRHIYLILQIDTEQ